jgi:hypothetical protein
VRSSSAIQLLIRGSLLGLSCLVIGALLLIVTDTAADVLLEIGAILLVLLPIAAAVKGAEQQFHPDRKVEGRTFVSDLWRSVPSQRAPGRRDQPRPKP